MTNAAMTYTNDAIFFLQKDVCIFHGLRHLVTSKLWMIFTLSFQVFLIDLTDNLGDQRYFLPNKGVENDHTK